MAITAETRNDIIELVVTAYDAAPGTTLLTELVAIVDGGGSLADVATALTTSDRWAELYPSFQTSEEFAAEWLGALVPEASEEALAEGVSVAVGLLNGGASFADLILEAQGFLSATAEDDASFGTSAANFNNKVEVATNHTVTLELDGTEDELNNVLADVTSDDDSVTDADDSLTEEATGTAFTLTDELDTISGTVNNDTVSGIRSNDSDENTFNVADSIDLGAGSADAVNLSLITGADLNVAGLAAENAEIINLKHIDGDSASHTATVDLSSMDDATQVWAVDGSVIGDNDNTLTVTGIDEDAALGLSDNDTDLDINFTTDGDDTSGDSITLNVIGSNGAIAIDDANGDGIDEITVATSGSSTAKLSSLSGGTDFDTLIITGDARFSSTGIASTVETIDASANTGGVRVNVAGSEDVSATGSAGFDTLVFSLSGGTINSDLEVSGFEVVALTASKGTSLDLDLFSDVAVWAATLTASPTSIISLNEVPADFSYSMSGLGTSTSVGSFNGLDIDLADDSGTSDAVTISIGNLGVSAGTNDASVGQLTIDDVETITLNTADFDDVTFFQAQAGVGAIDADSVEQITITGSGDLKKSVTGVFTADSLFQAPSLEELDASSATGDIDLGIIVDTGDDVEVTLGSGKDSASNDDVAAGHTLTLDFGDGDDTFSDATTTNATAAVEVDLGDGDDTATIDAAHAATVELTGGEGDDVININADTPVIVNAGFEDIVLSANTNVQTTFGDGFAGESVITLLGASGAVTFLAESGAVIDLSDVEFVGVGANTVTITGAAGSEDITAPENAVTVNAGDGDDTVAGDDGDDTLNGETGDDTLSGGAGDDTLDGGSDDDTISGGSGDDDITGGTGEDTLTGGSGDDTFNFAASDTGITLATADTITDFTTTDDSLDTGGVGDVTIADGSGLADEAAFIAAATAAFDGTGVDVYIAYDATGSGDAWVAIDFSTSGTFDATDGFVVLTGIDTAAEIAAADIA